MAATAATGLAPMAVSPDSITALVPSNTALATSVTSARVGVGAMTIDSSIWVAVIDRLPVADAAADDLLLDVGDVLHREAHAEVAAGDHHGVGGPEDVVEVGHRGAGLDLGHDHRAVGTDGQSHRGDVLGRLHERHGDAVDVHAEHTLDQHEVLLRGRAQGNPVLGEGHPGSAPHHPAARTTAVTASPSRP